MAAAAVISANAQQRLVLYEEFSGENCGPCAAANPTLNALMAANTSKTILLKYQSPIPSAGPIYNQNTVDVQARMTYYSTPFAPYGRSDGAVLGTGQNAGHVSFNTQATVDAAYAVATPFTITATHSWSSDADSIFINVTVTSSGAFNGSQMRLRAALVEHLLFDSPPGSNGETEFHNVMRKMYPNATGETVPNTWTNGQTQNYTISGPVPSYIDKADAGTFVILWLQDDANKVVAQAARTQPVSVPVDVKSDGITTPNSLYCVSSSASVVPTVTLKNTGTAALTSADIYTKVDNGAWTLTQAWTGNVAAGASANVALPAVSLTPGVHFIQDSLAMPNGQTDVNLVNNWGYVMVNVHNTTTNPLAIIEGFENGGQVPANWIMYDANSNGQQMFTTRITNQNWGQANSTYFLYHNNYGYLANEANYAIFPSADMTGAVEALDFWVASAPYTQGNPEPDRLEVVYSTNCGQTWTSVWSQQGAALNTAPATTDGSPFYPSQQSYWQQRSINVTSVPNGAMLAFRATSGYGNNLFIDNINLRPGSPLGVTEFSAANSNMNLFPNPAQDKATLSFVLSNSSNVSIQVMDAVGRLVTTVTNGNMDKGQQNVEITTANLPAGAYNVVIKTEAGTATQRLTVVR